MQKTNKELNQEHDAREQARVRPKGADYQFAELEAIVNRWIRESAHREQT